MNPVDQDPPIEARVKYDKPDGGGRDGAPDWGNFRWPKGWPIPSRGDVMVLPNGYECDVMHIVWSLQTGEVTIVVAL